MGGKKKSAGARTPYVAPNTLQSAQRYKALHVISEGVVAGVGKDSLFKSLYLNETPVQDDAGNFNFQGIEAIMSDGSENQSYVPDYDTSENLITVGAQVKRTQAISRTVSDAGVDSVRVTLGITQNARSQDNGDVVASYTHLQVQLLSSQGSVVFYKDVMFNEKGSDTFYQDVEFSSLPIVPFTIRVQRMTADNTDGKVVDTTYFSSYTEIRNVRQSHPYSALLALRMDSEQFGSSMPSVNVLVKGRVIQVPRNYNPDTREYSGVWDGSFKPAWTDNPAWILYDILTQTRFSSIAKRLDARLIDKWSLYEVAKYCDVLVDDGLGGKEPRFSCNVQILDSSPRQLGELVQDLCSAFLGMGVWTGSSFAVMSDRDADPVASYTNSNVADGKFTYGSTSLKQVYTAAHVSYLDKHDFYKKKTEYVSDDEAVRRYGLNIKSIEVFGCTSRGQAVRVGQWLLQTSLMQQQTISFSVGREGLRHLPYDIIRVADNDYIGFKSAGRVLNAKVTGNRTRLTLDLTEALPNDVRQISVQLSDGSTQRFDFTRVRGSNNAIEIAQAIMPATNAVWTGHGAIEPTLWRAITLTENTDDGTYTVSAVRHDPSKYPASERINLARGQNTALTLDTPTLYALGLDTRNNALTLQWQSEGFGSALTYEVQLFRNGSLYKLWHNLNSPEIELRDLPNGDYVLEVVAINSKGVRSVAQSKAFSINYTITGLKTTPKTLAVELVWTLPSLLLTSANTELWYGTSRNIAQAKKLAVIPAPQNSYTLSGVAVHETLYFWARLVDANGLAGEFTAFVVGKSDPDPAPIVQQITGAITQSTLSKDLISQLAANDAAAASKAQLAAIQDASTKIAAEAAQRQTEIAQFSEIARSELNSTKKSLQNNIDKVQSNLSNVGAELTAKANQLGTRITTQEKLNTQQAGQISTLTAAQGNLTTALETEKSARIAADTAESKARETLVANVNKNASAITAETTARTNADNALTQKVNAAVTRIGTAESGLTALQKTVANQSTALSDVQNSLTAKIDATNANLDSYKVTQANADNAQTREINAAKSQIANHTSEIGALKTTLTSQNQSIAQVQNTLTARLDNLQIGGRNYLSDSEFTGRMWSLGSGDNANSRATVADGVVTVSGSTASWKQWQTSARQGRLANNIANGNPALAQIQDGQTYTVSFDARCTDGDPHVWCTLRGDGTGNAINFQKLDIRLTGEWARYSFVITPNSAQHAAFSNWRLILGYSRIGTVQFRRPQIELGNVATDWTPAPEDGQERVQSVQAALDSYKTAQAKTDQAQTAELNTAKSQIANHTSEINSLKSTKADSNQVVSLARTGLQSEWQSAASNAQKAATDEAKKLNTATQANLTNLQQTVAQQNSAITTLNTTLSARLDNLHIGGRNLILGSRRTQTIAPHGAANKENQVARYNIAQDVDWAEARQLTLSINVSYQNDLTRAGSRWWRVGAEARVTLTDGTDYWVQALHNAPQSQAKSGRLAKTFVVPNGKTIKTVQYVSTWAQNVDSNHDILLSNPKLEMGNVATDWTPAPEDGEQAVSNVSAQITTAQNAVATLNGKVSALYTIKAETISNNRKVIAGLALGADGATGDSQMLVYANKLALVNPNDKGQIKSPFVVQTQNGKTQMALSGDFVADGTIQGKHIAAGQTLSSPVINGGSLNIGNGRFVVNSAGNVNIAASSGNVGLKISNERIEVYDENGVLRVRIGKLS